MQLTIATLIAALLTATLAAPAPAPAPAPKAAIVADPALARRDGCCFDKRGESVWSYSVEKREPHCECIS